MRTAFILLLLLFSNLLFSQNSFARQLNDIISDTTNHFQKFKGSAQGFKIPDSATYNSTIILEGTTENWIQIDRTTCMYHADIINSVSKNVAKRILAEWKLKLTTALGNEYKIQQKKTNMMNSRIVGGWYFDQGNLTISLSLFQSIWDKSRYGVSLYIANSYL
jgi:hypothetical protein